MSSSATTKNKNRPRENADEDKAKYDWRKDRGNPAAALLKRTGGNLVNNRTISNTQETSEQLFIESLQIQARNEANARKNRNKDFIITSREELEAYQQQERAKKENVLRRDLTRVGNWLKFIAWETAQGAIENARILFERALHQLGTQKPDLWIHYAKTEIRSGEVDSARAILKRAVDILPNENSLWLHAILLEKTQHNNTGIRDLFTVWLGFKPGHPAWREWIRFEMSLLTSSENINNNSNSNNNNNNNQVERIRNLFKRYIEEFNVADSWLFYASIEQEMTFKTSSNNNNNSSSQNLQVIAAKRAIQVLEIGIQSVPESQKDQTDAARLALAMASAFEASHQDGKAREIYKKLLDEFLTDDGTSNNNDDGDDDEGNDDAVGNERNKTKNSENLKKQLRDLICDSLCALEKRSGSLEAASAVEQQKQRWILEQKIRRGQNPNHVEFYDESAKSFAKLELLKLERKFLHSSAKSENKFNDFDEQKLTRIASLYERFCFPDPTSTSSSLNDNNNNTNFLEGLSICWESFVLFCEQDLLSQQAANGVMKRALEFLNQQQQQQMQLQQDQSVLETTRNRTILLCKMLECTGMLHLRNSDLVKFRMCMRLAIDVMGNYSDQVFNNNNKNNSEENSLENEQEDDHDNSTTTNSEDMFGYSSTLRMDDQDFELHPFFGLIIRWIELEKKLAAAAVGAGASTTTGNNTILHFKHINEILFLCLKYQLCRRCVDFWHLRADAVRYMKSSTNSSLFDFDAEISVLDEAMREIFGGFVTSFDSDVEEAYNSLLVRILKVNMVEKQDPEKCLTLLEGHCEKIEKMFVQEYLPTAEKKRKEEETAEKEQLLRQMMELDQNTANNNNNVFVVPFSETQKSRRKWFDTLLTCAYQMMQQFYFSAYSSSATEVDENDDEREAISLTRDFYKRAYNRIRKECGTDVSVGVVLKLWTEFEEMYGDGNSKKIMVTTSTAAKEKGNRLFGRAQKKK